MSQSQLGLLVGAGAAAGALARWVLTETLGMDIAATLGINLLGCFLIGWLRPSHFWGAGFLGGFTTMAAFAFQTAHLAPPQAALYVAATVIGCVLAALAGRRVTPAARKAGA